VLVVSQMRSCGELGTATWRRQQGPTVAGITLPQLIYRQHHSAQSRCGYPSAIPGAIRFPGHRPNRCRTRRARSAQPSPRMCARCTCRCQRDPVQAIGIPHGSADRMPNVLNWPLLTQRHSIRPITSIGGYLAWCRRTKVQDTRLKRFVHVFRKAATHTLKLRMITDDPLV
jgi:hypothetical protein